MTGQTSVFVLYQNTKAKVDLFCTKSVFTKNAKRLPWRSKLIKNIPFPKRRNSMTVLYLAAII